MISGDSILSSPDPLSNFPLAVATPQDALTALSEGIALLIDLAQRGEIDPWDVQVIDVIDRYLSKLTPPEESTSSNNFTELSQSGQAFLYASMLVLLKADSLMATEIDPNASLSEAEEFLEPEEEGNGIQRPQQLERQLRRRAVAKIPQKRRVTLSELIEQLQLMAATIAAQKARPRPRPSTAKTRSTTAKAIAELAHQENLVEMAAQVERLLNLEGAQQSQEWFELDQLLALWLQTKPPQPPPASEENPVHLSPNHDRVGVFWALLLLSAQSKVELVQEEFYQDLKIRSLTELSPNS